MRTRKQNGNQLQAQIQIKKNTKCSLMRFSLIARCARGNTVKVNDCVDVLKRTAFHRSPREFFFFPPQRHSGFVRKAVKSLRCLFAVPHNNKVYCVPLFAQKKLKAHNLQAINFLRNFGGGAEIVSNCHSNMQMHLF